MEHGTAESLGATISFQSYNAAMGNPRLIAAACSGVSVFQKVSLPAVEMNLRGFSGSKVAENAPEALHRDSYLADFDAVLKKTKAGKETAFFGYSHAGYFVTSFATKNPDRVSALILVEPALFTPKTQLLKRAKLAEAGKSADAVSAMLSYVEPTIARSEAVTNKAVKDILRHVQNSDTLAAEFRIRAEHPLSVRQLASLKMPVLLIGGTESKMRDSVTKTAAAIKGASIWWVRGATHLDLIAPAYHDEINQVVELFLNKLR